MLVSSSTTSPAGGTAASSPAALAAAPLLQPLDAPLPVALTGSGHGWFTRYRRYPVFSAPWVRGRTQVFALVLLLGLLTAGGPLLASQTLAEMPLGGLAQLAVQLFAPLLIGPPLALWVRRRGWPEARERYALAAVVVGVVLALLAFHQFGSEPLKQAIAEATGAVDESGKRKRMAISIGVSVNTAPAAAAEPRPSAEDDAVLSPMTRLSNGVTSALFSFWMAGGVALWGWRRERLGLAALAREQELERAQAQRREAELRLSVLAAQVEPHFLFNTLAGVRSAIATDPARASEMIDRLVDYLRAAIPRLRSSGDSEATLGGQLDIVRAYLGLMSARMPRLAWAVQADDDLLGLRCPPLMLISLAENAVKHGAEPKVGPVRVQVRAQRRADGGLEVTVADDGAGFGASTGGSGLGLSNIRERLRQMYGDAAALTLKARADGGVAATLSLPPEQAP